MAGGQPLAPRAAPQEKKARRRAPGRQLRARSADGARKFGPTLLCRRAVSAGPAYRRRSSGTCCAAWFWALPRSRRCPSAVPAVARPDAPDLAAAADPYRRAPRLRGAFSSSCARLATGSRPRVTVPNDVAAHFSSFGSSARRRRLVRHGLGLPGGGLGLFLLRSSAPLELLAPPPGPFRALGLDARCLVRQVDGLARAPVAVDRRGVRARLARVHGRGLFAPLLPWSRRP